MTDLELMYLLKENGYEPSLENLIDLKEGLNSGEFKIINESIKTTVKKIINPDPEPISDETKKHLADAKKTADTHGNDAVVKTELALLSRGERKTAKDYLKTLGESFSDYDLYKILDENGYTTTRENLEILKEGLISGKYTID